jgi:predicted RNA-binding Zn-ribbon protein involved in translation (DUF1610 family)
MMSSDKQRPHRNVRLRTIRSPAIGATIGAPSVLNASDDPIDYYCPKCGTVLLQAKDGQVYKLTIRCKKCGSYNFADVK